MSAAPNEIKFYATRIVWDVIRPGPMQHAEPFLIAYYLGGSGSKCAALRLSELHADGPRDKFVAAIASAERCDVPEFRDDLACLLLAAFGPMAHELQIAEAAKRLESSPKQ